MSEHISINEAAKTGVTRLRRDNWVNPDDHIEIYIADQVKGWAGPWVKLWSPINEPILKQDNPQMLLITSVGDTDDKCWTPYRGDPGVPSSIDPTGVLREDGT